MALLTQELRLSHYDPLSQAIMAALRPIPRPLRSLTYMYGKPESYVLVGKNENTCNKC